MAKSKFEVNLHKGLLRSRAVEVVWQLSAPKGPQAKTFEPFDLLVCSRDGDLVAIECKTASDTSFRFRDIREHQRQNLEVCKAAYLALCFPGWGSKPKAYLIPWRRWIQIEETLRARNRRSIPKSCDMLEEFELVWIETERIWALPLELLHT